MKLKEQLINAEDASHFSELTLVEDTLTVIQSFDDF